MSQIGQCGEKGNFSIAMEPTSVQGWQYFLTEHWVNTRVTELEQGRVLMVQTEIRGTADFQIKNWEGLVGKVCTKLSQWTWVLPQLSYRGRVLVTNNLIASLLWHRFTVLEPPEPLIKEVQKRIVNFFWAVQHWTRAPVLYLLLQEGGQGLIDLSCRVRTFRLQAAQRLLYGEGLAWADMAYALLWRVEDLNYDKHLFVLNLREMDLSATTLFYQSVLTAWSEDQQDQRTAFPMH
ncbi:hypothetical protein QTP86_000687 [Hemibagrus guttatus]|nr:hypothetical protein QTP86_000687 [Hemibagrus guttatus]